MLGSLALRTSRGDAMDIEESVGLQEEALLVVQFSLGDVHGGTYN